MPRLGRGKRTGAARTEGTVEQLHIGDEGPVLGKTGSGQIPKTLKAGLWLVSLG